MTLFQVAFRLSGEIEVECDDEDDAREYVHTLPAEQLLRWGFCKQLVTFDGDVAVDWVKSLSQPDHPKKEPASPSRRHK